MTQNHLMQGLEGLSVLLFQVRTVAQTIGKIHTQFYSHRSFCHFLVRIMSVGTHPKTVPPKVVKLLLLQRKSGSPLWVAQSLDINEKDKIFSKSLANLHRELQYMRLWKEAGCNLFLHQSQCYSTLQSTWQKTQISDN